MSEGARIGTLCFIIIYTIELTQVCLSEEPTQQVPTNPVAQQVHNDDVNIDVSELIRQLHPESCHHPDFESGGPREEPEKPTANTSMPCTLNEESKAEPGELWHSSHCVLLTIVAVTVVQVGTVEHQSVNPTQDNTNLTRKKQCGSLYAKIRKVGSSKSKIIKKTFNGSEAEAVQHLDSCIQAQWETKKRKATCGTSSIWLTRSLLASLETCVFAQLE